MSHDIFQSVPQGGIGAQDAEIAESKLSLTNSVDAVNYMKRNVEIASKM